MRATFALIIMIGVLFAPLTASATDWESLGVIDGVKVWKKEVPGSKLLAFRGEVVADIHIGQIMSVFGDGAKRGEWVAKYSAHETFKKGASFEEYRIHFDAPFPVSDRDYVLRADGYPDAEKRSFVCEVKSIKRKDAPENDCCVRAHLEGTTYNFIALPGKTPRTKMTVEVHTDPRGMLPNWVVNMIQKKWPSDTLNGLIRVASEKGVGIHPKYADWHNE